MEKHICKNCKKETNRNRFIKNLSVCPYCNFHDLMSARDRMDATIDNGSFKELGADIRSKDFLKFHDLRPYNIRLKETIEKTGLDEAICIGDAMIDGNEVSIGIMDFNFMGGSMGSVVGEKVKIIADNSIEKNIPLIIFSASGGARMQEGIISLMQMAKTVSCINRVRESKIPYFCIITNPTTGGVSASFASLADIIISEPGALFCFAGPRVVQQTIRKKIPEDFGLAERNLQNGQIDMILTRKEIRPVIGRLLSLFKG